MSLACLLLAVCMFFNTGFKDTVKLKRFLMSVDKHKMINKMEKEKASWYYGKTLKS